jgi:very-short-patch-repair endonuclease
VKRVSSNNYHYNPQLKTFANDLRKRMTKAEACLWKYVLRARRLEGYQFRRQRPVLNYIADFMCKEIKLIIEVDGYSHHNQEAIRKDEVRQKRLEDAGFIVVRLQDEDVLQDINAVFNLLTGVVEDCRSRGL